MIRHTTAMRDWGPVGLCSGVLYGVLVWVGLTACTLPIPPNTDTDVDIDVDLGDVGGGGYNPDVPGLVYVGHDTALTSHGISVVEETALDDGNGVFGYSCQVAGVMLPNTPVRDLERATIEFDDGTTEDRLYALVPTPGAASLRVLRMDGSEIRRIALPFVPKSFDLSPRSLKAYVVEENGPSIVRIDLVTNAIDGTATPMNGTSAALRHPIDVRVIPIELAPEEIWISDGLLGGVVILNESLTFAANVVLQTGVDVRIDYYISASWDLVDAVSGGSSGALWEVDRGTRTATRVIDAAGAPTISSAESSTLVGYTRQDGAAFSEFHRTIGELSAEEGVNFASGLTPVSQLTLDRGSFVALQDGAGGGAVKCLDLPTPIPVGANPSAFARFRFLANVPAPPPVVTHLLTVNQTPGGGVSIDPLSPAGDGLYPEGTIVTITATPNAGFTATLTGFDSVAGLTGQVTMNTARTVDVTFTPVSTDTTVTFSTSGVFRCTDGPRLTGCNTSSISSRGTLITFVPAARTESVTGEAPTVLGELLISCPASECGEANLGPLSVRLEIVIDQTAPFSGMTEFPDNGLITGAIQMSTSTAAITWAPGTSVATLSAGAGGPTVQYEVLPASFALPPSCPLPCPVPAPINRLSITGRVIVVP